MRPLISSPSDLRVAGSSFSSGNEEARSAASHLGKVILNSSLSRAERLRVLHVVVAGDLGGAERLVANLASRPARSRADHVIALVTANPKVSALFSSAGLKVHQRAKGHGPLSDVWRSFGPALVDWLQQIAERESAHLLHAHTFGSHVVSARVAARRGMPVLRTEHGVTHYGDLSCAPFRHWTARHTHRIVAVSQYVARIVARHLPEIVQRIRVVPNGIDTEHFGPSPPPERVPFTFAITARLVPWKQIHIAIEALSRIPDVRLDVAGEGSEAERLRNLARKRGVEDRVRFLGFCADPRGVLAASHAVLNCSRDEGLPLAVLEAASMQRPCVAFPVGGTAEVVRDGETGWLSQDCSTDSFVAAMTAASRDPRRAAEYGVNARERAVSQFGIDMMCEAYADLYAELAGKSLAYAI